MFNPRFASTYAQWGQIPSPTMPSPIISQTQLQSQTNDFNLFDMETVQETQFVRGGTVLKTKRKREGKENQGEATKVDRSERNVFGEGGY
jgi:hypothetical protein